MSLRRFAVLLTALVFQLSAAMAQIVPNRYIVEMSAEPVASSNKAGAAARRAAVRTQQSRVRQALASRNIAVLDVLEVVSNAFVVETSQQTASDLRSIAGVLRVSPVRLYKKMLDRALELQGVRRAWAAAGGEGSAGKGVRIAIIDSGIEASHPAFQDPTLQPPAGFPKVNRDTDLVHTNNKIIVARNYERRGTARDNDGHGTGVAMIAAGVTNSSSTNTITGFAPKAFLGNYKVFPDGEDGAPTDNILRALEDAHQDGMDIVNLSLGSFPTPRPEEDPLVQAIDRAVSLGMVVVVAAGNQGPDRNTIGSPATARSAIAVGNAYTDRIFASTATLDGYAPLIAVPGAGRNSAVPVSAALADVAQIDGNGEACGPLEGDRLNGRIALIFRGTCDFADKLEHARLAGAVAAVVYAREDSPEPVTMGVGESSLPAAMVSHSDGLFLRGKSASEPETKLTVDFNKRPIAANPKQLNDSSSKGPGPDQALKPDLVAIGTSVYTASLGAAYIAESGTSFSSPMVAGAAAVLKSARPELTGSDIRSLLVGSAASFGDRLGTQQVGAGLLDVDRAVRSTIAAFPASLAFGAGGGTVDLTRPLTLKNLSSQADTLTVTVVPERDGPAPSIASNTIDLAPGASRQFEVRLQGSNLDSRAYEGLLVVRSTRSDVETRIPYWYGVPSQKAESISLIEPETSGSTGSRQTIVFRVLDGAGIAMLGEPTITSISGGGSTQGVQSEDTSYPGLFVAYVQLSSEPGKNVFEIEAGGIKRQLTIQAE
ncbi:MAG TPA: S8 family serine peptidase [Bryobacteraceae bacterium]|nr:S8 family serine peptidase [Bryobacteraceae bacterium]